MTTQEVRQIEDFPLVEFVAHGTAEQTFAPGLSADGSIILGTDEEVAWEAETYIQGRVADNGERFRLVWRPALTHVLVTDQRLIYWLPKFDHGQHHAPLTGGALGIAASAVSFARAAKRQKANARVIAAGQLRYEHVSCLWTHTEKALIGAAGRYLSFDTTVTGPRSVRLVLHCGKADPNLESYVQRQASMLANREIPLAVREP